MNAPWEIKRHKEKMRREIRKSATECKMREKKRGARKRCPKHVRSTSIFPIVLRQKAKSERGVSGGDPSCCEAKNTRERD